MRPHQAQFQKRKEHGRNQVQAIGWYALCTRCRQPLQVTLELSRTPSQDPVNH